MKHSLLYFILLVAVPCDAQWYFVDGGLGSEAATRAFGVHDTSLFEAGGSVLDRYISPQIWATADNGIDFTQGSVTSFTSFGRYLFVNTGYRSSDNGASWQVKGGVLGFSDKYLFSSSNTSVYRSGDSGNTWVGVPCPAVNRVASIGTCVFASNSSGLWRSLDTGTNWSRDTTPIGTINSFAFIDSLTFGANGSIIKSTDSGSHWTDVSIHGRSTSILAAKNSYLFAGTDSGVYVSLDYGASWRNVSEGLQTHAKQYGPGILTMIVFDTLLIVNVDAGIYYGYAAARPISEMVKKDTPLSVVQTISTGDTIDVYPNPANGIVYIRSNSNTILQVSVMNLLGENVLDLPNLRESEHTLDISNLPSGTYFLQIQTAKGIVIRKIVKEE